MIETAQSAERAVDKEAVRESIALSYVKAWQNLPQAPADLLGTVLPVLAAQNPQKKPIVLLNAETLGDNHPDALHMGWKGLKKAAIAVHRTKVRHVWHQWEPETEIEHRCIAELVWTTEVHIDAKGQEVILVFSPGLFEYLPAILGPLSDFYKSAPSAKAAAAAPGSLTDYIHDRLG